MTRVPDKSGLKVAQMRPPVIRCRSLNASVFFPWLKQLKNMCGTPIEEAQPSRTFSLAVYK